MTTARVPGQGGASEPEFYEPARPRVVNHIVKGLIFAAPAATLIGFAAGALGKSNGLLSLAVLAMAWPFAAGLSRNIHALFARPCLRLSREGIHLRYWESIEGLAFLSPVYSMAGGLVEWRYFQGCRTFRYMEVVNLVFVRKYWKALVIATASREHFIGWDVFSPSVSRLQTAILDYYEIEFREPIRTQAGMDEFRRDYFRAPLRLVAKIRLGAIVAFAISGCASIAVVPLLIPGTRLVWGGVAIVAAICATLAIAEILTGRPERILELRAEGLAVGPSPASLRIIPWDQILCARLHLEEKPGGTDDRAGRATALEVRLRDRSSIFLLPRYSRSLEEMGEWINPPVEKLLVMRECILAGDDIESAAASAGIPPKR